MIEPTTRLTQLITALTEAKINEKRESAKLVAASDALKMQQAHWHTANEGLNAAKKALDDFILNHTEAAAKTLLKDERGEA